MGPTAVSGPSREPGAVERRYMGSMSTMAAKTNINSARPTIMLPSQKC
jgi:hypothetical protein